MTNIGGSLLFSPLPPLAPQSRPRKRKGLNLELWSELVAGPLSLNFWGTVFSYNYETFLMVKCSGKSFHGFSHLILRKIL